MTSHGLRIVDQEGIEDFLTKELSLIRERINRIKTEKALGNDGMADRGQVSADSSLEKVVNYVLKYGLDHAFELRAAISEWQNLIEGEPHLVDLGCGIGLSDLVLQSCGIEVSSYAGIDHNSEMLKLAIQFNLGSTFTKEIRTVTKTRGGGFLIINHLFGQTEVTDQNLLDFAYYISRIFNRGFTVLNIEPQMSRVDINRQRFRDLLMSVGYVEEMTEFKQTETKFKTPKNSWFAKYLLQKQILESIAE